LTGTAIPDSSRTVADHVGVLEQRVEAVRPHDASDDQPLDLARPVQDPPARISR
jgi:hypothetical protein